MESIKYLGVLIDKHLNWKANIDYVIKKLSYAARIQSIIRHYVNKQTLIKLYYSFAYPYLKYGIISWAVLVELLWKRFKSSSSSSSYIFIYQVTSYHKKKTATSSRSITKASKYAIPLKPTHKLAESMRYLVTW